MLIISTSLLLTYLLDRESRFFDDSQSKIAKAVLLHAKRKKYIPGKMSISKIIWKKTSAVPLNYLMLLDILRTHLKKKEIKIPPDTHIRKKFFRMLLTKQ